MDALTSFDVVVLALVALTGIMGLARGFVGELVSLGAWVAGVLAVRFFHVEAKALAQTMVTDETAAAALALVGLFVGAFLLVRIVGGMVSQTTRASVVGPIDRLLGLGFGLAKGVVAAVLLFLLANMAVEMMGPQPSPQLWLKEARTAPVLAILSRALVDFVDEQRRVDSDMAEAQDPHAGFGAPARNGGQGYDRRQRSALDKLLDEQEKQTPSTPI
ncbi:CvpA family protein [Polymorphobacter sp.]|uniref:CvpA family protein n=1 Tax=Polymorphobacter sp. TaxID=1909290 RepID=UPI003F6E5EBB